MAKNRVRNNWPPEVADALVAASRLSRFLAAGGQPDTIGGPIPLFEGERLYSIQPFTLYEFAGRAVTYNRTWVGIGTPLMFAATLGGTALLNYSRKQRAIRESAAQWRPINQGMAFLTSERFGLQGIYGWNDIHFRAIRNSDLAPYEGIVLFLDGRSALKLVLRWPEYHVLLFQYLAYRNVISLTLPAELDDPDSGSQWIAPRGQLRP